MAVDSFALREDLPNELFVDAIRGLSSTDYQNRIPSADKAGIQATIEALMDPANRQWKNEFIDALVNRIGLTLARSNSWSNPLAAFKRGMLSYGNTIEEIQVGLLKAHNYSPDEDYMEKTLFGRETPEVQANFHTVNRQDFYKVTVNEALLSRAFLDPTGLSTFVTQLMEAPSNSDQLDEFLLTTSLFGEYEANGGFYHVNVPNVSSLSSTADDSRMMLRKVRAMSDNLKFLSTKYNASHMPVFAKPEDLIIFVTPEANAAMDVEALAAAFNIDRALMHGRTMVIPRDKFGDNQTQAIVTTKDFFVIADQKFETTSQWNPANLHNNYFLHRWEVISCSRFVPAVKFWTGQDDEVINVQTAPTGITISPSSPTVVHGGIVQLSATVAPANADQGVQWVLSGADPMRGTWISNDGVLHLGVSDETKASETLTVTALVTANDESTGKNFLITQTKTITVSDDPLVAWPSESISNVEIDGVAVSPAFDVDTATYTAHVATGHVVTADDLTYSSQGSATVFGTAVTGTAPNFVVEFGVKYSDPSKNTTATAYTVNVTADA